MYPEISNWHVSSYRLSDSGIRIEGTVTEAKFFPNGQSIITSKVIGWGMTNGDNPQLFVKTKTGSMYRLDSESDSNHIAAVKELPRIPVE